MGDSTEYTMRVSLAKLRKLQEITGVTVAEGGEVRKDGMTADEEQRYKKLTKFGQAQFRVAQELRVIRDNLAEMEKMEEDNQQAAQKRTSLLGGGSTAPLHTRTEVARIGNDIRKRVAKLATMQKEMVKEAQTEGKQEEAQETARHIERTRALWKTRAGYGGTGAVDEEMSGPKRSENIPLLNDNQVNGGAPIGHDCRDALRDDQEFILFFQQVAEKDVQMDKAVDRIAAATARLKDNATLLKDELGLQKKLLDDTDQKVDKVEKNLDTLNRRLKKTLKNVDGDKVCIYAVCFLLLLGITGYGLYAAGVFKP